MVKLQNLISRKSVPNFQKQPFADVFLSRCSKKLCNIHRKIPALEHGTIIQTGITCKKIHL